MPQHLADNWVQADCWHLQVVPEPSEVGRHVRGGAPPRRQYRGLRPRTASRRGTPPPWRRATPGLTRTIPHRGSAGAGSRRSPIPPIRAVCPARQTGTSAPSLAARLASRPGAGLCRQSRHSSRKAAAASADPPPMPDATGRCFSSTRCRRGDHTDSAARARAARSTRLSGSSVKPRRERARHRQRQRVGGLRRQRIADAGEHDQAVQQVVAVRPGGRSRAGRG